MYTGGLVLDAAGLLKGIGPRHTGQWLTYWGTTHTDQRVVFDGNRVTVGGVTAGIDFALELVAKIKGEELAKRVQLVLEFSPVPPFHNGTPQEAGQNARCRCAKVENRWICRLKKLLYMLQIVWG